MPPAASEGGRESVGRYLSRQRRLRGIEIDELANLTKIPLRSLQRLESGCFDGESDGFVRGFVRTVAEALGLDPDDTVARMLGEVCFGEPPPALERRLPLRLVLAVLAILGLAAAFVALRPGSDANPTVDPDTAQTLRRDPVLELARSERQRTAPAVPAETDSETPR